MSRNVEDGRSTAAAAAAGPLPQAAGSASAATPQAALVAAAQRAREQAYAPYSKFSVGAAVIDEQGRIHAGANVENAAYPQGWCAETSALAAMVAAGGRQVRGVAVCAVADSPVTPCGGCRQRLREFAADDCPVWIANLQGLQAQFTMAELLPSSFGPLHLPRA